MGGSARQTQVFCAQYRIVAGLLVYLVCDESASVGLASASLGVWHWSSSPRLKYQCDLFTDLYQPLIEVTIPIIDRDTDPYRFRVSIKFIDMPNLSTGHSRSHYWPALHC